MEPQGCTIVFTVPLDSKPDIVHICSVTAKLQGTKCPTTIVSWNKPFSAI
jgi:hypothetical protein